MDSMNQDLSILERLAKFPKGKPADPTENMSPEDAEKWKAMNEEHGDKFKKTAYFTVLLEPGITKWQHPTKVLSRGAFRSERDAHNWVEKNAPGESYTVKEYDDPEKVEAAMLEVTRAVNKAREQGVRVDRLPALGVREMLKEKVVDAERGYLYPKQPAFDRFVQSLRGVRLAGTIEGPGIPDGTGPYSNTLRCPLTDLATLDMELTEADLPGVGLDRDIAALEDLGRVAAIEVAASSQIGRTIIDQMGGMRAMRMIGAKQIFWLKDGVRVLWPNKKRSKGNCFEVHLTGEDLYNLEFYNVSIRAKKLVKRFNGVMWDQLGSLFEQQTGWYLRMASEQMPIIASRNAMYLHFPILGVGPADIDNYAQAAQRLLGTDYEVTSRSTVADIQMVIVSPRRMDVAEWVSAIAPRINELVTLFKRMGGKLETTLFKHHNTAFSQVARKQLRRAADGDEQTARFEEGKPADPTENMSPEDAAEWKKQNEANKDKFKKAVLDNSFQSVAAFDQMVAEGCPDNLDETECGEWEANTEKYKDQFKTATFEEGARIPDGWDSGHLEEDPEASESEGSQVPDGDGNMAKRAVEFVNIHALVLNGGLLGATENRRNAYTWSYWAGGDRKLVSDTDRDQARVLDLYNVPLPIAEQLVDMGTRVSRMTTQTAFRLAKPYILDKGYKVARSGLYGFTKGVQADCESCVRKTQKAALRIAKRAYAKNEKVATFLSTHATRTDSLPAHILVAALGEIGPKLATDMKRQARLEELRAERSTPRIDGDKYASDGKTAANPVGKAQKAIMAVVAKWTAEGHTKGANLADIAKRPDFRGIHFGKIMSAAEALDKKGLIKFDGVKVSKTAFDKTAASWEVRVNDRRPQWPAAVYNRIFGHGNNHAVVTAPDADAAVQVFAESKGLNPFYFYANRVGEDPEKAKRNWRYASRAYGLADKVASPITPFEIGIGEIVAEGRNRLRSIYDPEKLAKALVSLRSFKKLASNGDMVKDVLIGLERANAIRRFDDDLFHMLQDEVEYLMGYTPRPRTATNRNYGLYGLADKVASPITPFEIGIGEIVAEGRNRLRSIYDPEKLAKALVSLRSFKKLASNGDMVKDTLIGLERANAIRRFDDDLFHMLQDEVEYLMGYTPRPRTATSRAYGLYGFADKVASLGLQACTDIRAEAGRIASDLHRRRATKHANITAYLDTHHKTAQCRYSRLLHASYPDAATKMASVSEPKTVQGWLSWED